MFGSVGLRFLRVSLSLRSQLANTNPYFAWAVEYILAYAEWAGADFTITSVNRTADQQWDLFRKFDTTAVAPGCSQHQYGAAVDVVFQRADWQRWWGASARNFGLSTVVGDPVHAQLVPGARFREWSTSRGFCPDPNYAVQSMVETKAWRDCLLAASRDSKTSRTCNEMKSTWHSNLPRY